MPLSQVDTSHTEQLLNALLAIRQNSRTELSDGSACRKCTPVAWQLGYCTHFAKLVTIHACCTSHIQGRFLTHLLMDVPFLLSLQCLALSVDVLEVHHP